MKNVKNKMHIVNIVACALIVVMGIVDLGTYVEMANMDNVSNAYVIRKSVDADIAYADGSFDGTGSDHEHVEEDHIDVNRRKHAFNILEIVPSQGMGVMGYTVGGCEPILESLTDDEKSYYASYGVTEDMLRDAYMDALVNKNPGGWDCNSEHSVPNDVKIFNEKMREGQGSYPFTIEWGRKYDGYYKYVGVNKGVYAVVNHNSGARTAEMVSKFYNYSLSREYNYIWVGSGGASSEPNDISVVNHPRLKYKNNDKFLIDYYGKSASEIDEWKEHNTINVISRTPNNSSGVGVTYNDIESADIIVINSGNQLEYYPYSQKFYNMAHGTSYSNSGFSSSNDFPTFEYAIRIYERVVIREDVAIISSKNVLDGHKFDTNLRKLMCMLYFVNDHNDSRKTGSGRKVFMDYLKRYGYEPGSHTTIDPETGNNITYYELQQKEGGDKYKAPNLSGFMNYDGTFMHKTHPLVKYKDDAITGYYRNVNGDIIPEYGGDIDNRRTAKRDDNSMFSGDGATLGFVKLEDGTMVYIDQNLDDTVNNIRNRLLGSKYISFADGWKLYVYTSDREKSGWELANEVKGHFSAAFRNVSLSDGTIISNNINLESQLSGIRDGLLRSVYIEFEDNSKIYVYDKNIGEIADEIWDRYQENANEYYWLRSSRLNAQKIPSNSSERENYENGGLKGEYDRFKWRMPLYESKSNTTDYVYIDDDGRFVRDTKYSGLWYGLDPLPGSGGGDYWEYKRVTWDAIDTNSWPWNIVEGSCLKEWWFGEGSTQVPGNSYDKHIHIYYDYYAYDWLRHDAVNDGIPGTYRNQSLEQENDLFKGNLIKDAVQNREVKREITDTNHMVDSDETDPVYYFLGVNIVNGDGVNKVSTTNPNKVLYINDYELSSTASIPLNFEVRTSDDILRIELIKVNGASETIISTFNASATNNLTTSNVSEKLSFSGGLELDRLRGTINGVDYDDADGNPKAYTGPVGSHRYVYSFKGRLSLDQSYYDSGVNNKFAIRVWTKPVPSRPELSSTDYMTIAVRDFFELE